jgi:hypothetical protein
LGPALEELYNEPNIVKVIKSSGLRWSGQVVRMNDNELPKKILGTNRGGQRGRGLLYRVGGGGGGGGCGDDDEEMFV